MVKSLTSLPPQILREICEKLPDRDVFQDYENKQQQLSELAESTRKCPRRCLLSTCKQIRHAPDVRALYTGLMLINGLGNCRPDPRESESQQAVKSAVNFPGLHLKALHTTILGLKFITDNVESRERLQQELESLKIYTEYSIMQMAGPAVYATLPSIIKGFRKLTYLDVRTCLAQRSHMLQVAASAPVLQLRVLKIDLYVTEDHTVVEPVEWTLHAIGALKTLEEVDISFHDLETGHQEVSLLPLHGLHKLRTLYLSTNLPTYAAGGHAHCVHVRHLSEVLSKCSRLTELCVRNVEVAASEVFSSPVLSKLMLSGCLCNCSWLERLQDCPHLQRVELVDMSLTPMNALVRDLGAHTMERALLAGSGPLERAAAGLAHFRASCLALPSLCISAHSKVTRKLGAQVKCLVPLKGSAAANALRHIAFEGVVIKPGAIADISSIFPQVQSVGLSCGYGDYGNPVVLKEGAAAAIVNGWGLSLLEIHGEGGWEGQVESIVAQARAAVQASHHRTLTARHYSSFSDEPTDYVLDPAATGTPAQAQLQAPLQAQLQAAGGRGKACSWRVLMVHAGPERILICAVLVLMLALCFGSTPTVLLSKWASGQLG